MAEPTSFGNPLDPENLSPKDERADVPLVGHLIGRFTDWEQARSSLEDKWDEYYRTWRCIEDSADKTRESERSQLKIPATKEAINNAVDSVFQIVVGTDPFFKLDPITPIAPNLPPMITMSIVEQKANQARIVEAYIRWIMQKDGFESKVHEALTSLAIYGTTVARVIAKPYSTRTTQREPMTGQPIPIDQTIIRPCLEHIPIQNFYIDPFTPTIKDAEGVFVKTFKKSYELQRLVKAGVISNLPPDLGTAPNDEIREDRLARVGISTKPGSEDVELLEYWGYAPLDQLTDLPEFIPTPEFVENGGGEIVAIIANRKHLLSVQPNPFYSQERPFVKDCYEEVPGEFYGIGIVEIASGPQKALDASVRSRIDNKALSINQLFALNVDKFLPGQNLSLYPGKTFLFRGDPRESLLPITVPDVTSSTYNDAAEYERYIQSAHGISRIVGGMPAKRGEQTATEVSMLMTQSNSRIKTIVKSFEDNFMEPVLRWYVRIAFQFLNQPEIFRLFNGQLVQITPADITEDFDFMPLGSVALNNKQEFQKRMSILQATANPVDMQFVNRPYLIKKAYETLNLNDTDIAILGQPPIQQQLMAQQPQPGQQPPQTGQPPMPSANPAPMFLTGAGEGGVATNTENQPGAMLGMGETNLG